eukprot:snap_masked-scaffold_1-processed-gene-16.79-mRNA-1 protein AED:1.00 eAED:1.00 QI:0/0/0/0/1/1/2/0/85
MTSILDFLEIKKRSITTPCDSQGAIKLVNGQKIYTQSRHTDVNKKNKFPLVFVEGISNMENIFNKPVSKKVFIRIRNNLLKITKY